MIFIKVTDVEGVVRYIHPSSITHLREIRTTRCRICTITDGLYDIPLSCEQVADLFGFELKE